MRADRYETFCITFPAGSSLNKDHWRLLEFLRPVADSLELADVSVGLSIAPANRVRVLTHAHAALPSTSHRGRGSDSVRHHTLQKLSALRVSKFPRASTGLAFSGRAHRAAVALIQDVSDETAGRYRRT